MPKLKVTLSAPTVIVGSDYVPEVLNLDGSVQSSEQGQRREIPANTPVWLDEDLALRLLRQVGGWRHYD